MKQEQDYLRDISEIRSMMERSTRFLSLSGWAGIMAGLYALTALYIAQALLGFKPEPGVPVDNLSQVIFLAAALLVLSIVTAIVLSQRRAKKVGETVWNSTTRQLLIQMFVPLLAGGCFTLILIARGDVILAAPCTLIFYGLALYNASKFTLREVRSLGLIQVVLGLAAAWFPQVGLIVWAFGFGVLHIVYGIYMHFRYER